MIVKHFRIMPYNIFIIVHKKKKRTQTSEKSNSVDSIDTLLLARKSATPFADLRK